MWPNRPPIPQNKVKLHPVSLSGESVTSKLERVRKAVTDEAKADAIVMSALDQIGWLFNLRGSDIMCNPVFFSYALISESSAHLFLGRRDGNVDGVLDGETKEELVKSGVTLHSYTDFNVAFLPTLIKEGSYVLVEKVRWEARSATLKIPINLHATLPLARHRVHAPWLSHLRSRRLEAPSQRPSGAPRWKYSRRRRTRPRLTGSGTQRGGTASR
jgi:hypothetical protein